MKLIVEMEMPQTCAECPIGDYFHTNCPLQGGKSYEQFQAYKKNERPSWCPIVGVLPETHGDLIDRDALFRNDKWIDYVDGDDIRCATAIVPATERSKT